MTRTNNDNGFAATARGEVNSGGSVVGACPSFGDLTLCCKRDMSQGVVTLTSDTKANKETSKSLVAYPSL
jgi:hypothetical protein